MGRLCGMSGGAGQPDLLCLARPVKSTELRAELVEPPPPGESRLEPADEARRERVRHSIPIPALGAHRIGVLHALEEAGAERRSPRGRVMTARRPGVDQQDVFVDLGLELELEVGGRQLAARALGHINEMAYPLEHLAEDIQARGARSFKNEPGQVERDLQAFPVISNEELLAGGAVRRPHVIVDRRALVEPVIASEVLLDP